MPRFCESLKNDFTFSLSQLKAFVINKRLFSDLKPTFRENVSFNYVNPSLFILNAQNSVFDFKLARPENIFKNVTKNVHHINYAIIYHSGP